MIERIVKASRQWSENQWILAAIIMVSLAASFYRGYGFSNNSYAIASWLVTYENGFIKRGLIGTILQLEWVSVRTGIPVPSLFFYISNGLLLALHGLVFLVLMRWVKRDVGLALLLPYFLSGPLLRVQSVWIGNIDHLLAILMIAMVYALIKQRVLVAGLIVMVGVFIHEIIFAMAFPILIFYGIFQLFHNRAKSGETYQTASVLLLSMASVALVILYQDILMSSSKTTGYISSLIARQAEDNYNAGAITEVYATPFYTWFLYQKDYFMERITDPALLFVLALPALWMLMIDRFGLIWSRRDDCLRLFAFILTLMPLGVLLIAWDIDRIWNLSVWTFFLLLWMLVENQKGAKRNFSSLVIAVTFLLSLPAFLMPQVRSNPDWSQIILIYMPMFVWQLLYLIGRCAVAADGKERIPCR